MWNRGQGGIILTAENTTTSRTEGVAWRCLLDGGNPCRNRPQWVAGRASGGGYNVRNAALAEAINGIIGPEIKDKGYDYIGWHNEREWRERAALVGWILYYYETAVVLIPTPDVAARIKAEIDAENK